MLSDHVSNIVMSSIKMKESLFPILQINLSIVQIKKKSGPQKMKKWKIKQCTVRQTLLRPVVFLIGLSF